MLNHIKQLPSLACHLSIDSISSCTLRITHTKTLSKCLRTVLRSLKISRKMVLRIGRPISGWLLATVQDNHRVTWSTVGRTSHRSSSFLILLFDQTDLSLFHFYFCFTSSSLPSLPSSFSLPLSSLLFSFSPLLHLTSNRSHLQFCWWK